MVDWHCPSCAQPLRLYDRVWRCENGHSYDVAKEGYVNLLLAQQKSSKQPGDNKAMVNARRMFLQQGHYQTLAQAMLKVVSAQVIPIDSAVPVESTDSCELAIFDAGCGEGYYLNVLRQGLADCSVKVCSSGVDISKFAIQKAAKAYPDSDFAVASTYHLPHSSEGQDLVVQVFAPSSEQEIARVLKPEGYWLTVNPAAKHLLELKQALYDQPAQHKLQDAVPESFDLAASEQVSFELTLDTPQIREALLMMTPFYWSASPDKKQALLGSLAKVTADFDLRLYRKC